MTHSLQSRERMRQAGRKSHQQRKSDKRLVLRHTFVLTYEPEERRRLHRRLEDFSEAELAALAAKVKHWQAHHCGFESVWSAKDWTEVL